MTTGQRSATDPDRLDVQSQDGTKLAVWVEGEGPPLVLVHGSIADHTTFRPFVDVLRREWTTFALDRRGFGASGDGPRYAIERDFEDVAAVVNAVAARTHGPVVLFGHSYGANCAMGGAAIARAVHRLVLYEPSLGLTYAPGVIPRIEAAVAAGDMERAIVAVLVEILEMTEAEVDALRASPLWPLRLGAAPTVPRECRVEESWVYAPGQFDAIAAPTLLLLGSRTTPALADATRQAAAAIPRARIELMEGHGHLAHKADPERVAGIIRRFTAA